MDQVLNISFENIEATAQKPELLTKYKDFKINKVSVNGKPLVLK